MISILHNITFTIIYVIVMAACIIAITVMDMKRIRMIRRNTEAVKENTRLYNKVLEESIREQEARKQYTEIVKFYRASLDKNTVAYEKLMRLLDQDQQAAVDGAVRTSARIAKELQVMPFMMADK